MQMAFPQHDTFEGVGRGRPVRTASTRRTSTPSPLAVWCPFLAETLTAHGNDEQISILAWPASPVRRAIFMNRVPAIAIIGHQFRC